MNYLYFAEVLVEDSAANPEALLLPASSYLGADPVNSTSCNLFFKSADGTQATREVITLTYATTANGGGFKRVIKALTQALNAHPADGFVVFADQESGTAVSKSSEYSKLLNGMGVTTVAIA